MWHSETKLDSELEDKFLKSLERKAQVRQQKIFKRQKLRNCKLIRSFANFIFAKLMQKIIPQNN